MREKEKPEEIRRKSSEPNRSSVKVKSPLLHAASVKDLLGDNLFKADESGVLPFATVNSSCISSLTICAMCGFLLRFRDIHDAGLSGGQIFPGAASIADP